MRSRGVIAGRFITAADEQHCGAGRRARARHRVRAVRQRRSRRADGHLQRHEARGDRRARGAQLVRGRPRTTTSRSCRSSTYSQRLVGGTNRNSVSSIYVKATSADTLSAAYQEADALLLNVHKITTVDERRLLDRDPAVDPDRGDLGRRHADGDARRHRDHLAARRRHRRDEHHVGVGHRAHPRDRAAQGARRTTRGSSAASSSSRRRCSASPAGSSASARARRRRCRARCSPTRG